MRELQRDLYQQLRDEAIETRERIAALVRPLDAAKLNEHPEPNGWSVGRVLEHLCVADERYEAPLAALMARASKDAGASEREWKPSFIGGLVAGWTAQAQAAQISEGVSARPDTAERRGGRAAGPRDELRESDG